MQETFETELEKLVLKKLHDQFNLEKRERGETNLLSSILCTGYSAKVSASKIVAICCEERNLYRI